MKSHLVSLYRKQFGREPVAMVDLRADGSNRSLYRLSGPDGTSVIGVIGPDHEENNAFISYSRALRGVGLPVPLIHAFDAAHGAYLEEDLGDTTLFDALSAARHDAAFPQSIVPLYERVVELLPRVQVLGGGAVDFSVAYPCAEFDRQSMMWDLSYFKYHFLKLAHIPFNEARLEADFAALTDFLLQADRTHFLYRDFQSRNIMMRGDEPWLIDYQGGRRGALQYDLASLLYDAKAQLPEELRIELRERYLAALGTLIPVRQESFRTLYRGFVLIRILQAMGAYGYRGFFERKQHFLASVPFAVANIEGVLAEGLPVEMPELDAVLRRIAATDFTIHTDADATPANGTPPLAHVSRSAAPGDAHAAGVPAQPLRLRVAITSFSYKRGYPVDDSGHGGGFVFDCRALHNPGRYSEYKALNGRDLAVRMFLEDEPATEQYWQAVRALVDSAVRTYSARGFEHLSVAFGCTGGQHRSVYFAERLSRHLAEHFPDVQYNVSHREEHVWAPLIPTDS